MSLRSCDKSLYLDLHSVVKILFLPLFQSFHNTLKDLAGTEKTEYLSDIMNGINIGALVFSHINLKRHRSPYYSHFCFLKLGK